LLNQRLAEIAIQTRAAHFTATLLPLPKTDDEEG